MKSLITFGLLLISLPCLAKERGFDPPKKIQTRQVGLSQLVNPPQEIRETCWAYAGSALVWQEDPGIKGIEKVTVREGNDPKTLCATNFAGPSRTLTLEGGWPLGVAGPFLFVQDEPLGNMAGFFALDLAMGKKIFSAFRDVTSNLNVENKTGLVSLQYRMALELPCAPSKADPGCWETVKNKNQIPASLALSAPDCEPEYRRAPAIRGNPRGIMVSAPVRVADLSRPQKLYLAGAARCEVLP